MISEPFLVQYGFLDWYGFKPRVGPKFLEISEGRIGRSDNPLTIRHVEKAGKSRTVVRGGWKSETTRIPITPEVSRVDLVVRGDNLYFLVRSDDEREIYPDTYEHLLSLLWKDEGLWHYATPLRDKTYQKDVSTGQHNHIRRRRAGTINRESI